MITFTIEQDAFPIKIILGQHARMIYVMEIIPFSFQKTKFFVKFAIFALTYHIFSRLHIYEAFWGGVILFKNETRYVRA